MCVKIMVIGAGQMGSGIAQVFAQNGYQVLLNDISTEYLDKSISNITGRLKKLVEKEKMTAETMAEILHHLEPTLDLTRAGEAALVMEAATENMEIKKKIFGKVEPYLAPEAILATNTSSIPITELASCTKRPEKVIGMHFMNPVPVMKLVEIIKALQTSEETYQMVYDITVKLGKVPVVVQDSPGFALNRILIPMINEAVYSVYESVADVKAIDSVMKFGANHPMGPLALADLIGLDTCLAIMEILHEQLGDDKYRPCPLLCSYVRAGWLGVKSGRGFYSYQEGTK
ncbi:3-hydroxybutyryl-CoA dehydrogenase [Candidatus Formimonas warabiya]|uniref:3-hydroxybutyryl-CoA dehydrogenase n=1 Tax=Formimonas warabiya TaxID=1761012 RepID=A0A3G1KUX7_FORW1|nr:3-hydroxybutyryl-CoA dehydrogenase [Candidatus Formimonas warabiya]ATW26313.1 3-hydroxybutyryl-CoA dehydrogenase [Candidatus Formimonas warabiya]